MKRCRRCGASYADGAAFCQVDAEPLVADEGAAADPYVGQVVLGRFAIQSRIGEGGMGTVYRAQQLDVDRPVAIKILRPEVAGVAGVLERFHREARLASRIQSPHVAQIILTGELPDERHFMVMEYLEGRSLDVRIKTGGPLSEDAAVHILRQLAEALAEAHEIGIVHRDLKPENVMLVRRGSDEDFVKVLDFGIAKQIGPGSSSLTGVGMAIGTPHYMPPEAAAGGEVRPASDVYSMGVILYEALAGELPFRGDTPGGVMMQHLHATPPLLTTRGGAAHVSGAMAALVHRCLAKSPDDRPADGRAFLDQLVATHQKSRDEPARAPTLPAAPAAQRSSHQPLELGRSLAELEQGPLAAATPPGSEGVDPARRVATRGRAPRRSPWVVPALAALAIAVGGAAIWSRGSSSDGRIARLEARAERAFGRGRLDGPGGAIALTEMVLTERSDHRAAIRLRKRIVERLLEEAGAAEREGRTADAIERLVLAERLGDDDRARARHQALEKGLEARRTAAAEPPPAIPDDPAESSAPIVALYVDPPRVVAGQPVAIIARLAPGATLTAGSTFYVRPVGSIPGFRAVALAAARRTDGYGASFVFPAGGRYLVGFSGARTQVSVADAARPPPAPPPVATTPEPTPSPPAPVEEAPSPPAAAPEPEPPAAEPEPARPGPEPLPTELPSGP